MPDLRQGVSAAAHRVLDELDMMDDVQSASAAFGRSHAQIHAGLNAGLPSLKATHFILAAAALIRAAELLEQPDASAPGPDGDGLDAVQAGEGAGSDSAPLLPPEAEPSPSPADLACEPGAGPAQPTPWRAQ